MIVGCLGKMVFEVSSETVRTVSNFQWKGKANTSVHKRHMLEPLTEFVGVQEDSISFELIASSSLGTNAMEECEKLWEYERNGTPVQLILGDHCYGKYRWLVQSHTVKAKTFDAYGNLDTVQISVSLIEYQRR